MLAALVVALAVFAVYVDALGGPFLWDDRLLVLDAPLVEKSQSLIAYLANPFWAGGPARPHATTYYRPLVTASFALDHRLHASNPGGFHLTNLVLHLACALLVMALLRRAGVRAATAALLACAWALLPRLAEAAAWISGRTDVLATVCVLAALLAWGQGLPRRLTAALFFTLGLLAKESAVALLPALVVREWLEASRTDRKAARALATWPLAAGLGAYLAMRFGFVGYHDNLPSLGAGRRALLVLQAVGTYLGMLFDPLRPRAVIGRVGAIAMRDVVLGALALALLPWLVWRYRGRFTPHTACAFTLGIAALVPVLHIVPIPLRTLAADRFLYMPTAAFALALGPGLDSWFDARRFRWGVAAAAVACLGFFARTRVGVWSDELEFWSRTYLETPHVNNAPATELFGVYYRAGLYEDALTLAERALAYDDPNKKDPRYNAALCVARLGRPLEAAERFRSARVAHRPSADIDLQIAIVELEAGQVSQARRGFEVLAARGDANARALLEQLPEFERRRAELEALDAGADAERRARLAGEVGDEAQARRAWAQVVASRNSTRGALEGALAFLVRTGDRAAIAAAAQARVERFGALEPELANIVEVRLNELDRLIAARARLGLPDPPRSVVSSMR
jgi:tetratricopeptide (TPR) repeat protein